MNILKKTTLILSLLTLALSAAATDFYPMPLEWKWTDSKTLALTYNYRYDFPADFSYNLKNGKTSKYHDTPQQSWRSSYKMPEGAVNPTFSPDGKSLAFTRGNNLWVMDVASMQEKQLTFDGSELILNGYASWVYYEEILGRPSKYCAFWWSPDSQRIGFYRFDNTNVPLFPIYSPFGQDGTLLRTRYPKAGETNPEVRIGIVELDGKTIWADFDPTEDQYFGIPFWGADSRKFYIAREPRIQNTLDLYAVSVEDGSKQHVYHEEYSTWLDWIEEVIFTEKGLYMARSFETGWAQIYFLSYDGKVFKRLTDGENWRISLIRVDEKSGDVYFTAERDSHVRQALYKVDAKGNITALTDPSLDVRNVVFSPEGTHFAAMLSNVTTPASVVVVPVAKPSDVKTVVSADSPKGNPRIEDYASSYLNYSLPEVVWITTEDGFRLPALITLPLNFDPTKKYPVHVDIYGGPDTPLVRDRWTGPTSGNQWWAVNGIIQVVADCRAAGHNGRAGTDMIYKDLTTWPIKDFVAWADYLKSLPYVAAERIGVEGFSFGGTMTTMLLCNESNSYHYGIAGGGVYDWTLYDTHYTERFMETPQTNPEGYKRACALEYVKNYPVGFSSRNSKSASEVEPVMLKITHGTGDDNVHFQNTMQLIDVLHRECKKFDFMIYPDGMHGYRGYQGKHFLQANRDFWLKYLRPNM